MVADLILGGGQRSERSCQRLITQRIGYTFSKFSLHLFIFGKGPLLLASLNDFTAFCSDIWAFCLSISSLPLIISARERISLAILLCLMASSLRLSEISFC